MITTKDKIRALAKLNGAENINNFPKCLGYFLKSVGYDFIVDSDTEYSKNHFTSCNSLTEINFNFLYGGHYILKSNFDNFPVIELNGDEANLEILIDHVRYNFNEFLQWYAKNFGQRI